MSIRTGNWQYLWKLVRLPLASDSDSMTEPELVCVVVIHQFLLSTDVGVHKKIIILKFTPDTYSAIHQLVNLHASHSNIQQPFLSTNNKHQE